MGKLGFSDDDEGSAPNSSVWVPPKQGSNTPVWCPTIQLNPDTVAGGHGVLSQSHEKAFPGTHAWEGEVLHVLGLK